MAAPLKQWFRRAHDELLRIKALKAAPDSKKHFRTEPAVIHRMGKRP
jgi:hypothetical protein